VVFGLLPNPTTGDSKTTEAGTTGVFVSHLTGLTENTLYYVRAYAVNSLGISYGTEVTGKTLSSPSTPTVVPSSSGYNMYLRTGIGDKAAYDAMFAVIEHEIFIETNYTPEEILLENIT
jgi:hypothetical protein